MKNNHTKEHCLACMMRCDIRQLFTLETIY